VGDYEAGAASHADFGDMAGRKGNCGGGVLDGWELPLVLTVVTETPKRLDLVR
jgi:hypothetical protein